MTLKYSLLKLSLMLLIPTRRRINLYCESSKGSCLSLLRSHTENVIPRPRLNQDILCREDRINLDVTKCQCENKPPSLNVPQDSNQTKAIKKRPKTAANFIHKNSTSGDFLSQYKVNPRYHSAFGNYVILSFLSLSLFFSLSLTFSLPSLTLSSTF